MSFLTESTAELWAIVIEGLEGEGFPYDPLTMTPNEYLATALEQPTAYLTKSPAQMLSELIAAYDGGTYSHLTTPFNQLLEILGTTLGGGGGGYVAQAVHFAVNSSLNRAGSIGPAAQTGFISVFVNVNSISADNLIIYQANGGNLQLAYQPTSGDILVGFFDQPQENYIYGFIAATEALPVGSWVHVMMAWDMGATRKLAVYIADEPLGSFTAEEDVGGAISVDMSANQIACAPGNTSAADFSSFGLWTGSSIVEADNTISEINRRKFVTADGKPVDPSNWPASPVLMFVGNAAAFATNQGTGGAFTLTGTLTDASTSPSD